MATGIYKPAGRAAEYAHLAINHYAGCTHGCIYCYCPKILRDPDFHKKNSPRLDVLDKLKRQAPKYAGTDIRILLSFVGDPYNPEEPKYQLTRSILAILREHDIPFQVLTKGGPLARWDFDLYGAKDAFATTMTLLDSSKSKQIELGVACPDERIIAIMEAYARGIETWVSLEPVLDAEQALDIIRQTHPIVSHYKIGALNHAELIGDDFDVPAKKYTAADWRKFAVEAIGLCEQFKRTYWIKASLAKYLDGITYHNTDTRKKK